MRWSEVRRFPRGDGTVRLLRGETHVAAPGPAYFFVPRRRWRVVVQEHAVSHILLDTRAEADAWTAYWTESGDER